MRKEGTILSGEYGTHPMDKYDRGALEPEVTGFDCALCGREIQVGEEVWRYSDEEEDVELYVDTVGCLSMLTAKYEADIDEFEFTRMEAK